ncbi:hypothetical protein [Ensifer adhaerens]|jgi:hypothetical protein|uniref:hypothetical protein n=1 Tax=Ensifer adhaerens TaxID=106592 RepID=UPI00202E13F2|nr:hypothetical protein [Ensifer adhaerens]
MSEAPLPRFRVHFHDGRKIDITAPSSLIAERKARLRHPSAFIKRIKLVREKGNG